MEVTRFCYECRKSTYENNNKGMFPPTHKVCLYCEAKREHIAKNAIACATDFVPEDKNNTAYHIVSHYDSRSKK